MFRAAAVIWWALLVRDTWAALRKESAIPADVMSACTNASTQPLPCNQFTSIFSTTKPNHQFVFTISIRPLELDLIGQGIQRLVKSDHWNLARIQVFHSFTDIKWMLYHGHRVSTFLEQWSPMLKMTRASPFWLVAWKAAHEIFTASSAWVLC